MLQTHLTKPHAQWFHSLTLESRAPVASWMLSHRDRRTRHISRARHTQCTTQGTRATRDPTRVCVVAVVLPFCLTAASSLVSTVRVGRASVQLCHTTARISPSRTTVRNTTDNAAAPDHDSRTLCWVLTHTHSHTHSHAQRDVGRTKGQMDGPTDRRTRQDKTYTSAEAAT